MINSQEHELKYMGEGYYQDTVAVAIKCNVIEMAKIMTFFTTIDFSNNTFRGEIPNAISKLKLLKGLKFSHNELTVSKFNVSKNQLVGPIPHGKQFDTFENDSYSGNTELCGLPLSKICNAHQSPPSSFQQEDDLEHGNGFDWKVVLMGYVSGVVMGISVGYLVLSNGTPDWLVKMVGRKQRRRTVEIT
ncbi:putative receptor like protein 25 [Prunus dulcis]|uniref:putative receptor like protein 25 n=1 Tax=Prunus dulcis TaxID=3755 RepID=UPI00148297DD|nr:putative receptor like protein 25 [Prunus dulcis]